jgi:hypothetical protein
MYPLAKKVCVPHLRVPRQGGIQPYVCPTCDRRSGSERALLKHMASHLGLAQGETHHRTERKDGRSGEPMDEDENSDESDNDVKSDRDSGKQPLPEDDEQIPVLLEGERDGDENDSDDGFFGSLPEVEADWEAEFYPFPNFTFGLFALAFATLGLSASERLIIISCVLTKGFDIEELRRRYSHDAMSSAIDKISHQLHPNTNTIVSTMKLAKRKKETLDATGQVLPQNQAAPHHQPVLSIGDIVRMDFANETTRPLLRFGVETRNDNERVQEFNQTPFAAQPLRYMTLVDFSHQGDLFEIGNFVECRSKINLTITVRRVDQLRYRSPTNYEPGSKTLAELWAMPPDDVRPRLQFEGPTLITVNRKRVLRFAASPEWEDASNILRRIDTPAIDRTRTMFDEEDMGGNYDDQEYAPLLPDFADLGLLEADQLVLYLIVFIDGTIGQTTTGEGLVNVAISYANWHSSVRKSKAMVRTLTIAPKSIGVSGPDSGVLQVMAKELNKYGPGTPGLRVFDVSTKQHRQVVLVLAFQVNDIVESFTTTGSLNPANATLFSRNTWATASDLCHPLYDHMDHENRRRSAQSAVAVDVMRAEINSRDKLMSLDAQKKVRKRFGLQHLADKLPWTSLITSIPFDVHTQVRCALMDPTLPYGIRSHFLLSS